MYGWTLSESFPTGRFELIDVEGFDLYEFSDDSPKGCILEFDLEYPKELYNLQNDYPLAPEKTEIKKICFLIIVRRLWT